MQTSFCTLAGNPGFKAHNSSNFALFSHSPDTSTHCSVPNIVLIAGNSAREQEKPRQGLAAQAGSTWCDTQASQAGQAILCQLGAPAAQSCPARLVTPE
jgi:hypothetical protein